MISRAVFAETPRRRSMWITIMHVAPRAVPVGRVFEGASAEVAIWLSALSGIAQNSFRKQSSIFQGGTDRIG